MYGVLFLKLNVSFQTAMCGAGYNDGFHLSECLCVCVSVHVCVHTHTYDLQAELCGLIEGEFHLLTGNSHNRLALF